MEIKEIEIRLLRTNSGQIDGLPKNPRKISKKNLEKLKKSVQDAPEMLQLRELIVVENGSEFVVIAGNQRLEAALDPHYCDVIIARWEKLTGKKATKIN